MNNIIDLGFDLDDIIGLDELQKKILSELKISNYSNYNDDNIGREFARKADKLRKNKILVISNDRKLNLSTISINKDIKNIDEGNLKKGFDDIINAFKKKKRR